MSLNGNGPFTAMNDPAGRLPYGFFHPLALLGGTMLTFGVLVGWPWGLCLALAGGALLAIGSGVLD